MRVKARLILFLQRALRICIVFILILSISNGFIFQFVDSIGFDFIEYSDFAEGEAETESEKESENEGIEGEFLKSPNLGRHAILKELNATNFHCYYYGNAYVDISTPPPDFI